MKLQWRIILENQLNQKNADKLGDLLNATLEFSTLQKIEKYHKFEKAYKIELEQILTEGKFVLAIKETLDYEKICMPWNYINYSSRGTFELIFHKQEGTRFPNQFFNLISWAYVEIEEVKIK